MQGIMQGILIAFLLLVLLLTILREIKKLDKVFSRFPIFMQFIPTWSFFTPIPNMYDYHLFYRGITSSGIVKEWQAIYNFKDKRPTFSFLWNPEKRFLKGFLDIVHDLMRFSNQVKDSNQICTSLPYLQILNFIDSLKHSEDVHRVQFMILTDSKLQERKIAFISEAHPLSRSCK